MDSNERYLVIYDGVCNFCNGAVSFIIKRDPKQRFIFSPMQSDYAQRIIRQRAVDTVGIDTFLLVKHNQVFQWSNAALEISKDLSGFWWCFNVLKIIPTPVRDWFYKLFARNRIRLFGRTEQCVIPSKSTRERFIL